MTPEQIQLAEQRLAAWRAKHPNPDSIRETYRREILAFTLNSMAMENDPVDPQRLEQLLRQHGLRTPPAS
jgi:hypothetical protein